MQIQKYNSMMKKIAEMIKKTTCMSHNVTAPE